MTDDVRALHEQRLHDITFDNNETKLCCHAAICVHCYAFIEYA